MKMAQKELAKHYIIDCNIKRFTNEESLNYIKSRGIQLSLTTFKALKSEIKADARTWITDLAINRNDYIALYKESIDELEEVKSRLWRVMDDKETAKNTIIMAAATISKIRRDIVEFYNVMPIVQAMKRINMEADAIHILPGQDPKMIRGLTKSKD